MALTTTEKLLYHVNQAEKQLKTIKGELAVTKTASAVAGGQPNCELEQTVLDAARILKEEACIAVELAQEDLDECLNQ